MFGSMSLKGLPGERIKYPRSGDGTPDGYTHPVGGRSDRPRGDDSYYDGADSRGKDLAKKKLIPIG